MTQLHIKTDSSELLSEQPDTQKRTDQKWSAKKIKKAKQRVQIGFLTLRSECSSRLYARLLPAAVSV